jgi:DNA-binding transcriptional LysR family regulator
MNLTEAFSLAVAGIGIAYVIELLARPYFRDGTLKWLLPQTAVEHDGAFLYYPRRASLAPKLIDQSGAWAWLLSPCRSRRPDRGLNRRPDPRQRDGSLAFSQIGLVRLSANNFLG